MHRQSRYGARGVISRLNGGTVEEWTGVLSLEKAFFLNSLSIITACAKNPAEFSIWQI